MKFLSGVAQNAGKYGINVKALEKRLVTKTKGPKLALRKRSELLQRKQKALPLSSNLSMVLVVTF